MARNRSLLVALLFVGWTLDGIIDGFQLMSMELADGSVLAARQAFTMAIASSWMWVPLSLAIVWCVRKYPIERGRIVPGLVANMLLVLGLILVRAVLVVLLNPWVGWYRSDPPFTDILVASVRNNLLLLWLLVGAAHAWVYSVRERHRREQAERLQARLVATRLEALSAQLNPHFLFNALNSIAEMVHHDADAADAMLVDLAALLRASLQHADTPIVPLAAELALLRNYLGIETRRLAGRLQVQWQIAPGLEQALVPHLLLQPLAENAIVHAIALRRRPGVLRIVAEHRCRRLQLIVEDDGAERAGDHGTGVGVANLRERLRLLYGDHHRLEAGATPAGGMRVRIELPLHWSVPEAASASDEEQVA